jgi:hypothetical protein
MSAGCAGSSERVKCVAKTGFCILNGDVNVAIAAQRRAAFLCQRSSRWRIPRLFSASRINGTFHVMDALLLGATA